MYLLLRTQPLTPPAVDVPVYGLENGTTSPPVFCLEKALFTIRSLRENSKTYLFK
jgi:hypothetical protein